MRVYGRAPADEFGNRPWTVVGTDANGYNDGVYVTALVQCLLLNLGESPFFGNYGIPARASVIQQFAPDYAVAFTQSFFSNFFASLTIFKVPVIGNPSPPTYDLSIICHNGSVISGKVPE